MARWSARNCPLALMMVGKRKRRTYSTPIIATTKEAIAINV